MEQNKVQKLVAEILGLREETVNPVKEIKLHWKRGEQYEYDAAEITLVFDDEEAVRRINEECPSVSDCVKTNEEEWVWGPVEREVQWDRI